MAIELSEIEKRLQSLIEVHLVRYLPVPSHQDRIANRLAGALRSLRAQITTQEFDEERRLIANQFELLVHPSTLATWQKDPRLLEGLTKVFGLVAGEVGLRFSSPPVLSVVADSSLSLEGLEVRSLRQDRITETQNVQINNEEVPIRSAFLIIGGVKVFSLEHAVTNIGRRLDNHLVIDDPRVSRYHAQIRYVRGRFIIFDLNSTGGTFVNGQRSTQSVLYPGDVISLAGLPVVFGQDNPPPTMKSGDTEPFSPSMSERKTANLDDTVRQNKQKP